MILIDWSQTVAAVATAEGSNYTKGSDPGQMEMLMRHSVLSSILAIKRRHGEKYGKIVIAADSRDYWRRDIFPLYKDHRAAGRAASVTDWSSVFDISTTLRKEIAEFFPYKVVEVPMAEADDIIGVLCAWSQENELDEKAFASDPQPIMIISNDGDFKQLHKFANVSQWNQILKKLVSKPEKTFLIEKILTGDSGDGIPNVRSTDDQLVNKVRQLPITAKFKQEVFQMETPGDFSDPFLKRNFQRNERLIDFDFIPDNIRSAITEEYINTPVVQDKGKIFNYLIKHRCRMLMEKIQDF